ncbi:MAG: hypothetical protein AAFX87_00840 [Bacteroidota bacterium]
MAQFKAFSPDVQVNGEAILAVVNAMNYGIATRKEILHKNGLKNVQPGQWYEQQQWLNTFKEIHDVLGPSTLFMIGRAIPEHAKFPPEVNDLQKALTALDMAYKMNHKGGNIGYYKLQHFDASKRQATMECKNPYPCEFDRGIILTMLRKFRPQDSFKYDVILDATQETRLGGGDSCTYRIEW